jgi:hypothetical protein
LLVAWAEKSAQEEDQRTLAQAMRPLAARVPPADSASLARRVMERTGSLGPAAQRSLVRMFAALAGQVEAGDAAALCVRVVTLAEKVSEPAMLDTLAEAFLALGRKLPADKKPAKWAMRLLRRLAELIGTTSYSRSLAALAETFGVVLESLPDQQAAALGDHLVTLANRTESASSLDTLTHAWSVLAGKLDDAVIRRQAVGLGRRLLDRAGRTKDLYDRRMLGQAFSSLSGRWERAEARGLAVRLAAQARRDRDGVWAAALDRLLGLLDVPDLVKLLEHPDCGGAARVAVLKQIGRRHDRVYDDVWELAARLRSEK